MNIEPSGDKVTFEKVNDTVSDGKTVANVLDVVMDKEFIEQSRHDWCWLGWESIPTEIGWYEVDRSNRQLVKISNAQAAQLEWHQRLFIYGSGHAAVNDKLPLALYIGDEYDDGRLSGLYLCGPDVLTWVALKQEPS